jgi:hypothetical protein
MKHALLCLALAACATAAPKEPTCAVPADRAEIQQVQVGWQRLDPPLQRPIVDPRVPSRSTREAEQLANDLLEQCRRGESVEQMQDKYSEVPGGTVVVGPRADVPYRSAALCMKPGECALIRSNIAFHLLKRIR